MLSAPLPEQAEVFVAYGFEPVVCTRDMAEVLADVAAKTGRQVAVHVVVDTEGLDMLDPTQSVAASGGSVLYWRME